ncbi:NrdF Ribonucleotide reductase, beta subunit [uncultured Caudovirales phage]|uniref:ribonucleoside-diphosphate reductase n=1 Tax=uncultured Caudovirales phage TaxID=2100421 RepID=A0A6J5L8Y3_9CAUD|nr:NrdF Ribonucleotide reductase, beta subunit [uncultured Caudovirales phage]
MSVFNLSNNGKHPEALAFLDPNGQYPIQRYETVKYPQFEKLTTKQNGFFWQPQEIDIMRDSKDFKELSENERHIFTSNLKRQILLDSVQGRSPNLAFLPLATIPELENWIQTWSFNETIHSRSYTHIIRNIYTDPSVVFDELLTIEPVVNCARDIAKYYDDLIEATKWYELLGEGTHTVNGESKIVSLYELKKKLWLALNSVNALEGIRFYVSFACSWAFAEMKKMEGNAKIIKLICRDENVHLGSTQTLIKILPGDDPDFAKIRTETLGECSAMFLSAANQEKEWADYLFSDGSMIGLNKQLLSEYVDWLTAKRMTAIGLVSGLKTNANPLPWTAKWIAGSDVQVAPQESEIVSYISGGTVQDIGAETFKGFTL